MLLHYLVEFENKKMVISTVLATNQCCIPVHGTVSLITYLTHFIFTIVLRFTLLFELLQTIYNKKSSVLLLRQCRLIPQCIDIEVLISVLLEYCFEQV